MKTVLNVLIIIVYLNQTVKKVPICRHLTSEAQSAVHEYADKHRRGKGSAGRCFLAGWRAFERIVGAQAQHVVAVAFMRLHDSGALRDDRHGFRRKRTSVWVELKESCDKIAIDFSLKKIVLPFCTMGKLENYSFQREIIRLMSRIKGKTKRNNV